METGKDGKVMRRDNEEVRVEGRKEEREREAVLLFTGRQWHKKI